MHGDIDRREYPKTSPDFSALFPVLDADSVVSEDTSVVAKLGVVFFVCLRIYIRDCSSMCCVVRDYDNKNGL